MGYYALDFRFITQQSIKSKLFVLMYTLFSG